jgi:hypothetical protein
MTLAGEVGKAMSVVLLGIADLQKELKEARAENDRLREALAWMENLDPVLVEAAKEKFALEAGQ